MDQGIFARISEERVRDVLSTLHGVIELPIQLIDERGTLLMSFGERIISRIIMLIGALGVAYCGYQMIMFVINSVL